jgi:hypothetical protein
MENLDLDFKIILRLIFKGTLCEDFERIQQAQARVLRELRMQRLCFFTICRNFQGYIYVLLTVHVEISV